MPWIKNIVASIIILLAGLMFFLIAPFSLLTGYPVQGLIFAGIGIVLFLISILFRPPRMWLYLLSGISLLGFLVLYFFTLPLTNRLPRKDFTSMNGVVSIQDAVEACRLTGLRGWALVAHAQKLAARKFSYSRRNPWDSPGRAFRRGLGYCQQQALALKLIYDGLGIESKPVQAFKNVFPPGTADGIPTNFGVSGHVWLRVNLDGEERDVCPGSEENTPGNNHFQTLSPVTGLPTLIQPLSHLGSVLVNIYRDHSDRRRWTSGSAPAR